MREECLRGPCATRGSCPCCPPAPAARGRLLLRVGVCGAPAWGCLDGAWLWGWPRWSPKVGGSWSQATAQPPAAPMHPSAWHSQSQLPDAAGRGHPGRSGCCLIMAHEQQRPCAQPLTAASRGRWCCGHRGHPAVPSGLPPVPVQEAVGANPVQAASAAAARAAAPAPPGPAQPGGQSLSQGRGQNPRALEPGHRAEAGSATGRHVELNNTR